MAEADNVSRETTLAAYSKVCANVIPPWTRSVPYMCYASAGRGQKAVHPIRVSVGQPQRPTVRTLGSPFGQLRCPHFIWLEFTDCGRHNRSVIERVRRCIVRWTGDCFT